MAYLSTNGGHVITTTQLSAPGLLPTTPHVVQHLENHHVNQTTFITQNKSARHQMFKGKLMGLGITEIVTGTIIMIIGIILISIAVYRFNIRDFSVAIGTPWWTGVLFIIAGSLAVAVETNPSHSLIRGCLAMNIISSIACLPAVLIYAVNLAYPGYCYYLYNSIFCYYHQGTIPCLVILLLLTLLITALSIAVSSLNCKAMNCCCATPQSTVVVLANPAAQFIPQQPFPANPPPYNIQATSTVNVG